MEKRFAILILTQMLLQTALVAAPPQAAGSESEEPRPMQWCSLWEGDGVSPPSSEGWTKRDFVGGAITTGVSDGATVVAVNDYTTGNGAWIQRFVNFEQPFVISVRGRYDPVTSYTGLVHLLFVFTGNHSIGASIYPTYLRIGAVPVINVPTVQGSWYNVTFDAKAPLDVDVYVNGIPVGNVEMYPTNQIIWDQTLNKPAILTVGTLTQETAAGMVDYIRTTMCPLVDVPAKTPDRTPPEILNVTFDDGMQLAARNLTVPYGDVTKVRLNATIDDTRTGNSTIWSANYSIMPRTWPGTPMAAVDGSFDWPVEDVTAEIDISSLAVGNYSYCVYARDYQGPKNLTGGCGNLTIVYYFYVGVWNSTPGCPEGTCSLHFEIMTNIASLVFFRWDFNDDGLWDTSWLTTKAYDTGVFPDDYLGRVCAQGWDGMSTYAYSCADYEVTNVPPTVDAGPDVIADRGETIDFTFNFTDPGFDDPAGGTWENFTATIDWGTGPPEGAIVNKVPGSAGVLTRGTIYATHAYGTGGLFIVAVTVCDDDGGCGSDTLAVNIPNTATEPTLLSPSDGAWIGAGVVDFSWLFVDLEGDTQSAFRLQIDNDPLFASPDLDTGDQSSSNDNIGITLMLPDGAWRWRVRTMDSAGLWSQYSPSRLFNLDRTPPTVSIEFGQPTVVANSIRYITTASLVWLNGTDAGVGGVAITYSIDGGSPQTYTQAFRVLAADGPHILAYSSTDSLGNAMQQATVAVVVDSTGPETSVSLSSLERGYSVSVSGDDDGVGVAVILVSIDGGDWTFYDEPFNVDAFGDHEVRAYAVDMLGNAGAVAVSRFSVSNYKPVIAGIIGIVILAIGVIMLLRDRARKGKWGIAVAVIGIVEVVIAVASWLTGVLAIPPWFGVSLLLDVAMIISAVTLCLLRRRSQHQVADALQPPPPPD